MTAHICPMCERTYASAKSLSNHRWKARCGGPTVPRAVDAAELLKRIDGIPSTQAARACGVDGSTVRRWRRTGVASPDVLRQVLQVLDGLDAPIIPRRPGAQLAHIDVHCTLTATGWIVDAYRHGTIDPVNSIAIAAQAGQRWPTLEAAHRFARRRFGAQLVTLTPAINDQEATA